MGYAPTTSAMERCEGKARNFVMSELDRWVNFLKKKKCVHASGVVMILLGEKLDVF